MRHLVLASLLAAISASAEATRVEERLPSYDAFLKDTSRRAVDVNALPASVRDRVMAGRISATEPRLGVPTFFWPARDGRDLRATGFTAEQAARRHLFAYAELYRFQPAAFAESRLARLHDLGEGAVVATFQRDQNGLRVFNDELKVVMNQQYQLIAVTGYLSPARKVLGEFALSSETAIAIGFAEITGRPFDGALTRLPTDEAGFERLRLPEQATPARIRRVYYPTTKGLEPAWHLELQIGSDESTSSDYFAFVYSARDGRLLYRKNLTAQDFSYRVWADTAGLKAPFDGPHGNDPTPHPTGTNNQFSPPYVAPTLVTLASGPISTNDPWLAPNATTTDGNNAVAYADFNGPDGFSTGDLKASTTAAGAFDRTYNVAVSPNASPEQRMAAVTQLFYDVNFFHDWYYDVGFDERAGNAQKSNLGRGGAGNDPLLAEGEDYSGTNNANMSTPADGYSPRMQMYVFTSGSPATVAVQGGSTYNAGVADFGPQSFSLTGDVVLVNDGDTTGTGGTVTDGCNMTWVTNVTGKIAAIDRGVCTFADKVMNAQANGATGVIIMNNTGNNSVPPLSGTGPSVTIPSLSISRTNGTALKTRLNMAGVVTTVTLTRSAVVNRDGTIDNAIVAHEWGHYISNRLIGDGSGISNNQAVGMGEGWADFHSMLMIVKEEDGLVPSNVNFNGTYGMAAYTTSLRDPNGFYWGIRRLPYSTNMLKNPLTFKHIQDNVALPTGIPMAFGQTGRDNSEYHNTGEVWATMLWECYAGLLRETPRLTFDQARDRMRAYLVAAYKITPLLPTFVEARDAVLASAIARDPADFAVFATAFAKRGIGMLAEAPDKDAADNRPVVESFANGNAFGVVSVGLDDSVVGCDRDGHLDVGETGRFTVTLKNVGIGLLSSTTGTVRTSAPGVTIAGGGALTFGPISPFSTGTASVDVTLGQVTGNVAATFEIELNDPTLATPGPVRLSVPVRLNFDAKDTGAINDDVEAPMTAWTFANNPAGATGSDFRVYADSGTAHWFFGPNPDSPADTYLISPWLDVGTGPFSFSFSHRYQFEGDEMEYFDGAVIEISDGGAWVDLGMRLSQPYTGHIASNSSNPLRNRDLYSGESPSYPAWSTVTADLGTTYASKRVRIRFRIGSDDALGLKGWEIDNLQFVGITNRPFPAVVTDPNLCTNRAPVVTAPAQRIVFEGTRVKLDVMALDPDNEPLSVTYTQVAGPLVTMEAGDTFMAPEVVADTTLEFEVVASDGRATSSPVTQVIVVKNVNKTPVVTLTPVEQTVDEGAEVAIEGAATDGDGDQIVGYRWVQKSGPAVSLTGLDGQKITFTAPEVAADTVLSFELYARDVLSEGAPAVATVTVHNVIRDVPLGPVAPMPPACGCSSGNEGLTTWLAVAMALFVLLSRKARR